MTGKQLLFEALRNRPTPRPGWVPFVGVHGGKLIGVSAAEYLQSAEHIITGLKKARELYQPDGLPVVFDLQMEAEVLGCQLRWADDVPPSAITHPLETDSLNDLQPFSTAQGRFPILKEVMAELQKDFADEVALFGLITGPFTLAMHLRGNQLFLDMLMDKAGLHRLMDFCADVGRQCAGFYLDHGADVIAVVDPMTSQISAEHFEEYIRAPVNTIFEHIRQRNAFSSLFVCGDATRNLEVMFQTSTDSVFIDENIPLAQVKELAAKNNKAFGGNLKLTSVLLFGSESAAKLHAIENIDLGGSKGFILAPGCDLPYACPEANLQAVSQMVYDDYQREVARSTLTAGQEIDWEHIVLEDYATNPHITVEVGTLDSTSCAPCQYMYEAALIASQSFGGRVKVIEHKISTRDGLGYMMKLGITSIPSICIDGEVVFKSIIPDQQTLIKIFEDKLRAKGSL